MNKEIVEVNQENFYHQEKLKECKNNEELKLENLRHKCYIDAIRDIYRERER